MSDPPRITLILGMHRSGTSALAAVASRLGLALGKHLLGANEYNAKGYFENEAVVGFHSEMLAQLGSSWHDPRFLPTRAFEGGWVDKAVEKLSGVVGAEFGSAMDIVIKDPRTCRLLPIWNRFARERDVDLRFILIGRNPKQVSASLARRDGFSSQKSLLLWLQYNLLAERETRIGRRLILRYQELLDRPGEICRNLAAFLEIEGDKRIKEAATAIDRSQVHNAVETEIALLDLRRWTTEVWEFLFYQRAVGTRVQDGLDRISHRLRRRLSILPEEAIGRGDYEAAVLRRRVWTIEKDYKARNDALHKKLSTLKQRYKAKDQTLQRVVRERDAVRQEQRLLRKRHQEQEELGRSLEEIAKEGGREIATREVERKTLHQQLEILRHHWTAFPVRREVKRLIGRVARDFTDLPRANAAIPKIWNKHRAGFNFGVSLFPDLASAGKALIQGWILSDDKNAGQLRIRLVGENGAQRKGVLGQGRADIEVLFREDSRAAQSGFTIVELEGTEETRWRLEAGKRGTEWAPLALLDLCGVGAHHLGDIREIAKSQVFEASWYARRHGLVERKPQYLISHYLREGAARGWFPNPLFDTRYYFASNPEICASGENPLLNYLRAARKEKPRQPNRWFEPAWYLERNKDAQKSGLDPLVHYLRHGRKDRRDPGPRFDVTAYLKANPGLERSGLDPLVHYIHNGSGENSKVFPPNDTIDWIYESASPVDRHKLNILFVGHLSGDRMFGGERSLLELVQLVDRERFNIFCSFPRACDSVLSLIKPHVAGVAIFPYEWWNGKAEKTDGFVRQFKAIMRDRRIDLVHVNSIVLRDPLLAAKQLGIPSILHVREIISLDPDLAQRIGLPADQIASDVAALSDFVIANSHFTEEQVQPGRSFVLYNTADEVALNLPLRKETRILRVGMLSSNIPKKGLADFFTITSRAREKNDPLEFWLVGPETEFIKKYFQSGHDRCENIRWAGYVEEPAGVLRELDVVINLSTFAESFGRSVAEGMLARRPAVVYAHGALPELVRDRIDGFVVPFRDTQQVLDRLNRLALDRSLLRRMGESAHLRAIENFSRAVGAVTLNGIYDTILKACAENHKHAAAQSHRRLLEVIPTEKKMRIGYFIWHFPTPSETFVLNELREFLRLGHDVLVFCRDSPHKDFKPDFAVEWYQVKSPDELAERIKQSRREIMHSHFVFPTVTQFLWPACELAQVPFTFIAHAIDIFRRQNAEQNRLGEVARSAFCRKVFAPGSFHRDFFIQNGVPAEKIIINPQGILFDAYEAQPIAPRLRRPKMSVCAIHRFVEKKGLHHAIRAAGELAPHGISLHLYGYGPLERSYRELVTELHLNNVFFRGAVKDRDHMIEVFREHDLFLCPSVRGADGDMDGIPTILLEAMASHVPVVASRLSSIPDVVMDGVTGYLAKPGDVASLTQAILRFYQEPVARAMGIVENGRELVRKRFDVRNSNQTLLRTWANEGLDVILVTHNAPAEVRQVIERLYRFTKTPFQLFIVDNGSEAETLDYLHSVKAANDNVCLLPQEKNLFVGPGTNKGLEAGTAPIAVYLCSREGYVLAEGWDQEILNYMATNPAVGLAGTLGYSPAYFTGRDYIEQLEPFPRFRNSDFAANNDDRVFRHVQGGMLVIRRSMYEAIGGFSESVPHNHTDVEYSYYVESCGWELGHLPDSVILYQKSRPLVTARLNEFVRVVHPGCQTLASLFDSVVTCKTNLCNVCGRAVLFVNGLSAEPTCPICGSGPYQRSLYRFLAESTETYRKLVSLYISAADWVFPDWSKMFRGQTLDFSNVLAQLNEACRINQQTESCDLVILQFLDDRPPLTSFFDEVARILKPNGLLVYHQPYGACSMMDSRPDDRHLSHPDEIATLLESLHFRIQKRVRYASAAVRYSEHEMFVCGKSLAK